MKKWIHYHHTNQTVVYPWDEMQHLTDTELLQQIYQDQTATSRERELCRRLEHHLGTMDELPETTS